MLSRNFKTGVGRKNAKHCLLTLHNMVFLIVADLGFPVRRGRVELKRDVSWADTACELVTFPPFSFYPDKQVHVQITTNHWNSTRKNFVHEATVSWVENVNYQNFKASNNKMTRKISITLMLFQIYHQILKQTTTFATSKTNKKLIVFIPLVHFKVTIQQNRNYQHKYCKILADCTNVLFCRSLTENPFLFHCL